MAARVLSRLIGVLLITSLAGPAMAEEYCFQEDYLGEAILDQFGIACSPAGDVNGDGYDDFLVGANVNDDGALSGGKAYLYLGGQDYPESPALSFAGALERGYVGQALASGDLNGDPYSDWVVGAPGMGADGQHPGRVYVFLGGADPDAVADLVLEGIAASGQFGAAVCIIPDLDGDGYGDLIVGAPRDGDGCVYIYRGGPEPLDGTPDRILTAGAEDKRFGRALAFLPDLDSDGRDELLVGSPKNSETAVWAGAVHLFYGTADLDPDPDMSFLGEAAGDEFGSCLAAGPDLDGDGQADFLVGAPAANAGGLIDAGKAYLFRGGAALDTTADLIFSGDAQEDRLGGALAMGFDWDGDDNSDLALGLPDDDGAGTDAGAVQVYRGGGGVLDTVVDYEFQGPEAGSHLGKSLASGGDVRDNLRGTLLAGGYNEVNTGRVLLYGSSDGPVSTPPGSPFAGRLIVEDPWPNPFNPTTTLRFRLPADGPARVSVLDARGRRVATLLDARLAAGPHQLRWDAEGLASGAYLVVVEFGGEQSASKAILLK